MATGQRFQPDDIGGNGCAPKSHLRSGYIQCSKDPMHSKFFPFKDFKLEHLPKDYRNEDILNWILINGELTVRIRAFRVSSDRPGYFMDTSCEYPMVEHRGGAASRFGTGYVAHVGFYRQEGKNETPGGGQNSSPTSNGNSVGGYVIISTSTHVVYDEDETRGMKIDFFHDGRNTPIEVHVKEQPSDIPISHFLGDWCELKCHTENYELLSKLIDLRERCDEAERKIRPKFDTYSPAIIVSHPHGQIKHVTMGRLLEIEETITMSHLVFYPDGTFLFSPNSEITFELGCELCLPPGQEFTLPTGNKISLPKCENVLTALSSFSISPLKELTLKQNQPFTTPPNTDFVLVSDVLFSCSVNSISSENGNDSGGEIKVGIPKGTVFRFDKEFPLQRGRHCPHLSDLKSPLAVKEYSIAKRIHFDAHACEGSSGAKVLFLAEGKKMGFAHSGARGREGQSGSGCIYKLYSESD